MYASDIRILELKPYFHVETPRALFKFGSAVAQGLTLCHVRARVENRRGQVGEGWGAIFLSHLWAYRSPLVDDATKDRVMRRLTEAMCHRVADYPGYAHPVDIFTTLEPEMQSVTEAVCRELGLSQALPLLGTFVSASPIDAALHDAFGVVNGISTYAGYSREFMRYDLGHYLGAGYGGRYLSDVLKPTFEPALPVFHVVGGLDIVRQADVSAGTPDNGLPRSLEQWIEQDGVYCFKLKPRGNDMRWDTNRVIDVYAAAVEKLAARGQREVYLSLDPNEQCESPAYMIELLEKVREQNAAAFDAILYIEQPVERDLTWQRHDMRALSALKPVLVDESLLTFEDWELARELGWSGIALKTCKCHTSCLLMAARAAADAIPYSMQDLTNPGIALIHSVGLAARLQPIMGVETNARQYYPDASLPEAKIHPGITHVRDGRLSTASLTGHGLGYRLRLIERSLFHPDP